MSRSCQCGGVIREAGQPYWDILPSCSCTNPVMVNGTGTQPQSREQTKATIGDSTQNQPTNCQFCGSEDAWRGICHDCWDAHQTKPQESTTAAKGHAPHCQSLLVVDVPCTCEPKEAKHTHPTKPGQGRYCEACRATVMAEEAKPADTMRTWEDIKTSNDSIDRLAYFISNLSPHNLWRGVEALREALPNGYTPGGMSAPLPSSEATAVSHDTNYNLGKHKSTKGMVEVDAKKTGADTFILNRYEATAIRDLLLALSKLGWHGTGDWFGELISEIPSEWTLNVAESMANHIRECSAATEALLNPTTSGKVEAPMPGSPSKSTDKEYNYYLGIDYALQHDPAFRREYIRKHEAPTSSDGQGVSEDTMPLDEITSILIEYGEACYDHSGNTTHRRVAKERIQSLISSEKVKELKALLTQYQKLSWGHYDVTSIIEQRIEELESD